MGRVIQLDFGRKEKIDQCLGNDNAVYSGELAGNITDKRDNDLLMINMKLTPRIKNSLRFLANFETRLVEEITGKKIGQYVGWDCNQECVSLFISGENAAALSACVVSFLKNLEWAPETVEVISYLQGEIHL